MSCYPPAIVKLVDMVFSLAFRFLLVSVVLSESSTTVQDFSKCIVKPRSSTTRARQDLAPHVQGKIAITVSIHTSGDPSESFQTSGDPSEAIHMSRDPSEAIHMSRDPSESASFSKKKVSCILFPPKITRVGAGADSFGFVA